MDKIKIGDTKTTKIRNTGRHGFRTFKGRVIKIDSECFPTRVLISDGKETHVLYVDPSDVEVTK